jgi:hypothetical protein
MTRSIWPTRLSRWILPGLIAAAMVACQEHLAAPADCPALCPGGYGVRDTIIDPEDSQDSSFAGYAVAGQNGSVRVSDNFAPSDDRAIFRFLPLDSVYTVPLTTDSVLPYTIDSVVIALTVAYRDTSVKNLYLYLYRLPSTLDSNYTFADADAAFIPANFIDSLHVDDTLQTQRVESVLMDSAALARVARVPGDSGKLAVGVAIRAAQGTGVRLATAGSGIPTVFTYVHVFTGDTTENPQLFSRVPEFSRFVSRSVQPLDQSVLTVGGAPSARSIIRFPWSPYLRDSAQLLRVSLELIPTAPIPGLRGDTAFIQARPVLADFGSKSPTTSDAFYVTLKALDLNQTDTVHLEILRSATLWQGTQPRPPAIMLQLIPEAVSFTRATFGSTRTQGLRPRLRVTYALKFPFEEP